MPRGQGRGHSPNTKKGIITLIVKYKVENPGWSAKDIQQELLERANRKKSYIPQVRTIQGIIVRNRDKIKQLQSDSRQHPWSLGILDEHRLPLESVPVLLEIQSQRIKSKMRPLTVREAEWGARLYTTITNLNRGRELSNIAVMVDFWVGYYSFEDFLSEIGGGKLDTSVLDEALFESRGEVVSDIKYFKGPDESTEHKNYGEQGG